MLEFQVTADSLHVRSRPQIADNVLGHLQKGDVVQQVAAGKNEQFVKVRHGQLSGWASAKWLKQLKPKARKYVVTASSLSVRSTAKVLARNELGVLKKGDVVLSDSSSSDGKWLHVAKGALNGFASAAFLVPQSDPKPAPDPASAGNPPWYSIAKEEKAKHPVEKPGSAASRLITKYLRSTNLARKQADSDETFWCSAFVNWCVEQTGHDGTNSAGARSWMHWGRALERPTEGCIVVLWRTSKTESNNGHVGFYVKSVDSRNFQMLGGNQSNTISYETHPKSRILGYRKL